MGHVYYQAEQWVDARDAYQDTLELYTNNNNNNDDSCCSSTTASCHKQELVDLRRDIQELDQRIAVLQRNNNSCHEARYLSRQQQQQQQQSNEEAMYF
jgi:hypothetical protein